MKLKTIFIAALAPVTLGGALLVNNSVAKPVSAKSYTIPSSMRGNWYAYNGRVYYHMKFGKYGEYLGGTYAKQKSKVGKYRIGKYTYNRIFTSVNPYYARVTSGKYAGKSRKALLTMSQGLETVYFRSKVKHAYMHQAPNGRAKKLGTKKVTWRNGLPSSLRGTWIKGNQTVIITKSKFDFGRPDWADTNLTGVKYHSAGKNTYVLKGTYHNGGNFTKKNSYMKMRLHGKTLQFKFSTSSKYQYLTGYHRK